MIERIRIVEDFQTLGHFVIGTGRPSPGARMQYLTGTGEWVELQEGSRFGEDIGFKLPEGVLDGIVREYLKVAAPGEATAQHLEDTVEVRNRLLALIEKRGLR